MRAPRTRFAAPFVAIVAAGCSAGKGGGAQPSSEWAIRAQGSGSGCFAEVQVCDRCNPPAPIPIACPIGAKTDGSAHIVTFDGKTCSLDGKPIDCPTYDSPAPPPPPPPPISIDAAAAPADDIARVWSLSRDPHGGCSYFQDSCSHLARAPGEPIPPCNPPPSRAIACPPYVDATMGAEVVQHEDGSCTVTATGARVDCLP